MRLTDEEIKEALALCAADPPVDVAAHAWLSPVSCELSYRALRELQKARRVVEAVGPALDEIACLTADENSDDNFVFPATKELMSRYAALALDKEY